MKRFFDSRLAGYLNRAIGLAADIPLPSLVLDPAIGVYGKLMGVEMDGVEVPADGFSTFGDFFARKLEDGAREVCEHPDAMVSPSDGKLTVFGEICDQGEPSFTIKGHQYSVAQLMGNDNPPTSFDGGGFAVVYLHPRDYHRVHAPVDGDLVEVRHIPGARYPVAPWSEKRISGIFGKNERVVFEFELEDGGFLALVMVAAYGVSNMETHLGPPVNESCTTSHRLSPPKRIERGEDLGAFRLGSTVVLLWTEKTASLEDSLCPGPVRMGDRLGSAEGQKR